MSKSNISQKEMDLFKKAVDEIPSHDHCPDTETSATQEKFNYSHFNEDFTVTHWHNGRDKVEFGAIGHLNRFLKQSKGKIKRTMDMHGMTVAEAAYELDRFLATTQSAEREQMVLLIHGKGYQSDLNRPKLKNATIHWLENDNRVSAFCSAKDQDGGSGAIYLLLKRKQT